MTDIAIDPSGQVYGVDAQGLFFPTSNLYKVNLPGASTTLVGGLGVVVNSLEFRDDGLLFGAGRNLIYQVNTTTGATAAAVTLPAQYESAGDIEFDAHGNMYVTMVNGSLIRIAADLSTWQDLGSTSFGDFFGLILASDGRLYGFRDAKQIYRIDVQNASATFVANITDMNAVGVWGAATDFRLAPPSLPNLAPYQPPGWSAKIVVSTTTGTSTDSSALAPTDTLYVDWAVSNNGSTGTAARFYTELYVDGVLRQSWYTDPPLNANFYTTLQDYSIGSLSTGSHTLRIKTDSTGAIAESNETDNEYTKTITVSGGLPNLTPYQVPGWSDKIVVSTTTGTNTDSSPLAPTNTLYVDWAVVNDGAAAAAARFYTELYVDGGLRQSWYTDPPLNANTYTPLLDYPIGSLSAGTHSIKIKTDATGAIAERDEGDNEYTKTVTVGSGCTVSCSASVPATATTGVAAAFAATATPSNCTGSATYDWDFGDGSPSSTQQNPSHTYTSPGTYVWTMRAAIGATTCARSGTIPISGTGFSGTVTDAATGAGISGASVNWGSFSATTDGNGNYNLNSLPCQTNTLTVSKSGYQTSSQSYTPTCNASNLKNVTLTIGGDVVVFGDVLIGGQHATGGIQGLPRKVTLIAEESGATYSSPLDSNGSYRISVPVGQYRIRCDFSYSNHVGLNASPSTQYASQVSQLETVTGPSQHDVRLPPPIVFLHGWRSGPEKWDDWAGWLASNHPEQIFFTPTYKPGDLVSAGDTYVKAASDVRTQLLGDVTGLAGSPPRYRVIAHSKGGVVLRFFLNFYRLDPLAAQASDVILLGTPNNGTKCFGDAAATLANLSKCYIQELNGIYPSFGTLPDGRRRPVHVVAGTKSPDPGSTLELGRCPLEAAPKDGVVPVDSVMTISNGLRAEGLRGIVVPFGHTELGSRETLKLLTDVILPYYGETTIPASFAFPQCPLPFYKAQAADCDSATPGYPCMAGRGYRVIGPGEGVCDLTTPSSGAVMATISWLAPSPTLNLSPPQLVNAGTTIATGRPICPSGLASKMVEGSYRLAALLGYDVYRDSQPAVSVNGDHRIGSVESGETTFTDPYPAAGTNYYAVTAVYESGESTASNSLPVIVAGAASCVTGSSSLCMAGNRFRVQVAWRAVSVGTSGVGQAVPLTSDTGYFWFFHDTNVELVVKVLDGRTINGHFWVFYGALSNVEYTITVTDTVTGEVKTFFNPQDRLASVADTAAFPLGAGASSVADESELAAVSRERDGMGALLADLAARPAGVNGACEAGPTALCLNGGRFRLEVAWRAVNLGTSGAGQAVPLTSDTGYFWFFNDANVELVVKVLDGRGVNGHFWVFYGALSNVEYTITVTDTVTGVVKTYHNPQDTLASVADTSAF